MSWATLAYTLATGGVVTDADMGAATDPEFSQRNNHTILTEDYVLGDAWVFGANVSKPRIKVPLWNTVTEFNLYPYNKSATVPSPPQRSNFMIRPPKLPKNEEIKLLVNDSANEQVSVFLNLLPGNWNKNLPAGIGPLGIMEARITLTTPALTANAWSGLATPVFDQTLRQGTYAIVGAMIQGTGLLMARFVFPEAPMYAHRKLRPGVVCTQSLGDLAPQNIADWPFHHGEIGRFNNFELFNMEFWSGTAGAVVMEGRLWLVWLNEQEMVAYGG